jgi:hypothetical protein
VRHALDLRTANDFSGKVRLANFTLVIFGASFLLGGLVGVVRGESFGDAAQEYRVWGIVPWGAAVLALFWGTLRRYSGRRGFTDD